MSATLTEPEFRLSADAALESLERALLPLCDEHDVEIELQNGVMQIVFEAPAPAKFIVSPNAPVRQIWVSAMSRSYKLAWDPSRQASVTSGFQLFGSVTWMMFWSNGYHALGVLDDGRKVSREMFRELVPEELAKVRQMLGEKGYAAGKYEEGAKMFEELTLAEEFVEFLTLPAYDYLTAHEHR